LPRARSAAGAIDRRRAGGDGAAAALPPARRRAGSSIGSRVSVLVCPLTAALRCCCKHRWRRRASLTSDCPQALLVWFVAAIRRKAQWLSH
jgi:hypothetical protein